MQPPALPRGFSLIADFQTAEIRKSLSQTLATFVPFLSHNSPQIAARLELFLTQTLAVLEPVDKKVQAANAELNDIIDESMGLGIESIVVADMPVMNSRAGLYVWLNSLVCCILFTHEQESSTIIACCKTIDR